MDLFRGLKKVVGLSSVDAIDHKGKRRRSPATVTYDEDHYYRGNRRRKLQATARESVRNYAIAQWALRKHLDYISTFRFQSRSSDRGFNKYLEAWWKVRSSKQHADVSRRHSLATMLRLCEAQTTVIGDHAFLKIKSSLGSNDSFRGKLQAIEGDRIAYSSDGAPKTLKAEDWLHGVSLSPSGAARAYMICRRTPGSNRLSFERTVPARSVFFHANYERFDQVRGVSPIASSLSSMADIYEGFSYAMSKLKVAQLFGLATYRASEDSFGSSSGQDTDGDGSLDEFNIDLTAGPMLLDLDSEDRAEFLEAKTPATETVNFLELMIAVTLKSLDIPMSFFDESKSNFYGSRAGLIQYQYSAASKRSRLREVAIDVAKWWIGLAIIDGTLELPSGWSFEDLDFEFISSGIPWWDPLKESKAALMSLSGGLDSPQNVCHQSGTDFYSNVDALADAKRYAAAAGVPMTWAVTNSSEAEENVGEAPEEAPEEEE